VSIFAISPRFTGKYFSNQTAKFSNQTANQIAIFQIKLCKDALDKIALARCLLIFLIGKRVAMTT